MAAMSLTSKTSLIILLSSVLVALSQVPSKCNNLWTGERETRHRKEFASFFDGDVVELSGSNTTPQCPQCPPCQPEPQPTPTPIPFEYEYLHSEGWTKSQGLTESWKVSSIGDPRKLQTWLNYKQAFNKSYGLDEDKIRRTFFARRMEYFKEVNQKCRKPELRVPEQMDGREDALKYPMTEPDKLRIFDAWLKHHSYLELVNFKDYRFSLFTIHYFHSRAVRACAGRQMNWSSDVERLLF